MSSASKKLIIVFVILITFAGVFNFQQRFSIADINTSTLLLFILIMGVLVWKLEPLFRKELSGKQDPSTVEPIPENIKTRWEPSKGKIIKVPYKTLGSIAIGLLLLIFLLDILGYFHMYTLNKKRQFANGAEVIASGQQVISQQIRNDILVLNFSNNQAQQEKHQEALSRSLKSFKEKQEALRKYIYYDDLDQSGRAKRLRQLFTQVTPYYNSIVTAGENASPIHSNDTAPKDSRIADIETTESQFLLQVQQITEQYRSMVREINREYVSTTTALLISLVAALVLMLLLVLIPTWRSGNKSYKHLYDLLKSSRRSESLMRTIINSMQDLIFVKNKDHRYQLVNQAFAKETNSSIDAYINKTDLEMGMPDEMIYGNSLKGIKGYWKDDEDVMTSGQMKIIPELPVNINSSKKIVTTIKIPLKDEAGKVWGILGFVRDISELKKKEEDSRKKDELLHAMATAFNELIRNNHLEEAMGKSVVLLGTNLQVDKIAIHKIAVINDVKYAQQLVGWNRINGQLGYNQPEFQRIPVDFTNEPVKTLLRNEIYSGNDADLKDVQENELFDITAVKSLAVFPIFTSDHFWGFVSLNDIDKKRDWKESELSVLLSFANILGSVLERRGMLQRLITAKTEAEFLHKTKNEFMADIDKEIGSSLSGVNDSTLFLIPNPSLKGVLIVDNNATSSTAMQNIFNYLGIDCSISHYGTDALAMIKKSLDNDEPYDLILTDQKMTGLNGVVLAKEIKKLMREYHRSGVLMFSSNDNDTYQHISLQRGADEGESKPVKLPELNHTLSALFDVATASIFHETIPAFDRLTESECIMVVEDDPLNMMLLAAVLQRMGFSLVKASNGKEALEKIQQYSPVLVFMDVHMPVMNGSTSTSLIRSLPQPYCNVPVIGLMADSKKEETERCLEAGMDSFISKPFKVNEITTALKNYLLMMKN